MKRDGMLPVFKKLKVWEPTLKIVRKKIYFQIAEILIFSSKCSGDYFYAILSDWDFLK